MLKEIRWSPTNEKKILKKWQKEKIFKVKPKKGKFFVIDTPPPYPSGRPWHIGAVAQYSQIDMIARVARMLGFEVLLPFGVDRNGIPVERFVERELGISLHAMPREKFIKLCKKALDQLEKEMVELLLRIGFSADFKKYYRTDSKEYRAFTQSTFLELWKKGLIYEATRPNNFCPNCGTTLADADISYEQREGELVYIKFRVEETNEELVVATTRPELLCSCQAVIFNPEDQRYKLEGYHARIPLYARSVPILAHPAARPEFGSGLMMICSYGDLSDVRLFRELRLKEIVAIDQKGRMSEEAGVYAGLSVEEARRKIVEDLRRMGLVEKVERIKHSVPVCDRCGARVEIVPMPEYYLKQLYLKERLQRLASKLIFFPEKHRQLLLDWLNGLTTDWPISRRRYYATEIPLWYCKRCKEPWIPKPGKYYQPWKQKLKAKCSRCGSKEFEGEQRTLDTWVDSSITPLFLAKFFGNPSLYPSTLRPQGRDIVRTWLYYTLLRCVQLTGKLPFKHAWIGGMGLDEKGEKMSKSKGNIIDPVPLVEKYGADAFRFWSASEASLGEDFRCSEARIEKAFHFLTKLWNVARFVSCFLYPKKAKLKPADRWILAELEELTRECLKAYQQFNFFIPATRIREFVWNIFASHYVELVKARAYSHGEGAKSAWFALHECLRRILLLLAPITPFFSDCVWRKLYGKKSIHLEKFPKPKPRSKLVEATKELLEFNARVWKLKKQKGISLKHSIQIKIPKTLSKFKEDLVAMHNLK